MTDRARPILTTAWVMNDGSIRKAASESQQLPEDPFAYALGTESGLQQPPYDLDQLAQMLETNTLHYRACKQKAADVVGRGIKLRALDEGEPGQDDASIDEGEARWNAFVEAVESDERGDESFKERIQFAHEDFESIGWGALEFSRDAQGNLDGMWHVPGHTLRAHKDGRRFAQKRAGKTVWFKRFGLEGTVDRADGGWSPRTVNAEFAGNELVIVRNYTPRSSYYGLPDHIPAMSAIAGWRAQAEFNVRFFDNQAVPAYAVIIEGADITPELEEQIREHFRALKGDPHATLVLPVPGLPGDDATQVKVRFEKLAVDIKDASFRLYKQDNALEICIAHGIPPYRVSWPIMGSLGGATAEEMTKIYVDSIVQPRQETWDGRLTRALLGAKGLGIAKHELKLNELDTRDELADVQKGQMLIDMGVATPAFVASFLNLPEGASKEYRTEAAAAPSGFGNPGGLTAIDGGLLAKRWGTEVSEFAAIRKQLEQLVAGAA